MVFVFLVVVIWIVVMRLCRWWVKKKEAERRQEEEEIEAERRTHKAEGLLTVSKLIEIYTSGWST